VGIDKLALEAIKQELDKNSDYMTHEISETNEIGFLYQDKTGGSQFLSFIQGEAIFIGECHVDIRCTGTKRFYTIPEHKEEAVKAFNNMRAKQQLSSDAYYSQPWV
tara:strand:- start:132 stop:449 length:318 start_codon:yes stop_codon:yes gene_type:complete